ncbi:MAG: DUF4410 domain-containing protein [Pyrinomonadaceae bacterium]
MRRLLFSLGILLLFVTACAAQGRSIELVKFDIKASVNFPPTWVDIMMAETVDELTRTKKFTNVTLVPETNQASTSPDLRLTGSVKEFQPGSKSTRFWIGFGAGKAKIVAVVKIVEVSSGKGLLERDVDGSVIKGAWGPGDASEATRGVAIEIAKRTKKLFP